MTYNGILDLDAIRASRAACADIPWSCSCVSGEQLDALVAEVERHRAALRASPPDLLPLSECLAMRDEAVQVERAAVVAWLRAEANAFDVENSDPLQTMFRCGACVSLINAADDIEHGEHRRKEAP